MRSSSGAILGLALLAGLCTAAAAFAEETPQACEVAASLLASDSPLPKVTQAVKDAHSLNIVVAGSRSSTIPSAEANAYPARLLAYLKERLSSVTVNVSVELQIKKTAAEVAAGFVKLLQDKRPTLVIWQTGTVDAMRSVDPEDFRAAVDEGVATLQKAGTDVILINLQYSPRTESVISAPPYLDNLRVVAQQYDVPLFDRFAIMQQWNDSGDFDFFSASPGLDLVKRVHDCLGRALSKFVIDAAHLEATQQN
ncbi:MAG: SGNH/GDSL hydrolase family protein [Bradyrhizobium sp.]|uniref:SGNH/GDSL hydrolase family protein n=1 Tax=Bradyrhizobium sp. TaxID=376 RepID=UPI001C283699|nr:SGNH/GDSL hydrolase family protein [Bradyrhizobium sp.]MBU6462154.1 SGNH/GDSL hydrolase family protein [Pseudomonadota bacterium]MDE2067155.1 SGNH/GDSL hydrolase family protein [Bradyrhizobium sp.]MDE2240878.1 SGNH/GDSL hydrolase family protein [Bradyrhizobium sp.]MDE2472383.1 SGNH/GDSL hydrolase family protein [Bradyrhizobium sp.]